MSDSGSGGKTFHFKVDTGACGNLLPYNLYKQIAGQKAKMNFLCHTIDCTVNLVAYNNKRIKQLGTCTLHVSCDANTRMVKFFIVDSRLNSIIGLDDSHKLQLVNFNCPIHQSWTGQKCTNSNGFDSVSDNSLHYTAAWIPYGAILSTLTKDWIVNHPRYKHLFKEIGKFNVPPLSITLKDDAQPIQKPPRKVQLAMKHPFKEELDRMQNAGIISKYDSISGPAPEWLNSFVMVKKPNGSLHICLHPTDLNKYIVQPVCNSYTLEEIIDKLKGSLFFAIFDTTKGFFHVPMDKKSKLLAAMLTPYGIYIYNVLAMGLPDATDIFELCIHQLLQDLQGVLNIADDILVFGRAKGEFHSNVISFLDRCVQEDTHFNPDKVQINTDSVPFFGHVLTKDGVQPDMSKVRLILDWPIPENQKELQQFMGFVNYLSKFLAFLSDLHAPLQLLLKKDSEFTWTDTHTIAFNCLKEDVSNDVKLQFFDSSKPLIHQS